MKQEKEQVQLTQIQPMQSRFKSLAIPLMYKKLNSVEKYVNLYKTNQRSPESLTRIQKIQSRLSNNGQRLVYGGKFTPDPQVNLLAQNKCYVKYQPLLQQKTEEKIQQLDKIQIQYEHLKNNLSSNREPFTSKFTLPLHRRRESRNSQTSMIRVQLSPEQIQKQLKKQTLVQDGQKYFVDLYLMNKDRSKLKDQIQKNRKFTIKDQSLDDQHKQKQKYLLDKKIKQAYDRKNKMLKNKGLHWNVYYEMLALSKTQKQRIKGSSSSFVSTYGVD